ncbi:MAG: hypothetical protein Q7T68_11910 [Sphingopyxis sp.]|nr:hypothetical protein [Sphingopyxis sp.]
MATVPTGVFAAHRGQKFVAALSDPAKAIRGPLFDLLFFWGSPVFALLFVDLWLGAASVLPQRTGETMVYALTLFTLVLTNAHLFAVAPRAYLNRDVFEQNRFRLTVVPLLLLAGLLSFPLLLVIGGIVAFFWDVHHSAMQNFGLSRIYDMKAGNGPQLLRRADLRLNWTLYVGPLAAGASLMTHLHAFDDLRGTSLQQLAALPGVMEGRLPLVSLVAIIAYVAIILWSAIDYRAAMKAGYRPAAHKLALIGTTGLVSLLAWGFSSPLVALVAINIYHAVQYFALVWLKEGDRMAALGRRSRRITLVLFGAACTAAGIAYHLASGAGIAILMAPFVATSLLHFWFDSFVWSVRKKQV